MRSLLSRPGLTSKTLRGKSERPTLGSRRFPCCTGTESYDTTGHTTSELFVLQKLCVISPDFVEGTHVAHMF